MNSVFTDFETRALEVDGYFKFVLRLAREELLLRKNNNNEAAFSTQEYEELIKTLKATCYLLLYNLVESTMRNSIEAIFDELKSKQVIFDNCRTELRDVILRNFKKRNTDKLVPKLLFLARDVIHETFEANECFSGNLDARAIRNTAKQFGFKEPKGQEFHLLLTVKDLRNDLAHGVKSFGEVGRNSSPDDLDKARSQTVAILSQTLENIKNYLKNQDYLVTTPLLKVKP